MSYRRVLLCLVAALFAAVPSAGRAQDFPSRPITLVCRLDGVPTMGEGLHLTAIESRAFRSGNVLTVDHYRSGVWISQTRLFRRGEQLTIESRSKFNTVTAVYRRIS